MAAAHHEHAPSDVNGPPTIGQGSTHRRPVPRRSNRARRRPLIRLSVVVSPVGEEYPEASVRNLEISSLRRPGRRLAVRSVVHAASASIQRPLSAEGGRDAVACILTIKDAATSALVQCKPRISKLRVVLKCRSVRARRAFGSTHARRAACVSPGHRARPRRHN
ncbi:hypothetical protein EVAR_91758_1 [Eumeta japonica]|uniref:Uncharacterized protein n=1 Tax=Eumeta variegata TaxID=151549 RepID=A0A4C1SLJ0_EUMVA|nr:hypothetical protein EVAR_91758_1 [Eumeta japonica]